MFEYFLYATKPEMPDVTHIVQTAQRANWSVKIARNWQDWGSYSLIETGPFQIDDVTIGWPHNTYIATSADIERAVVSHNRERIEELIRLFELGNASWITDYPFVVQSHLEFDGIEDARRQMGDAYAAHIAKTKRKYTIFDCQHGNFFRLIGGVMAILTEGMIEDPQSALCAFPPPRAETLAESCNKWLSDW